MTFIYCHSGGINTLERFTLDGSGYSSIISDRTPVLAYSTGTFTLTGELLGQLIC